jgi:hypothetical protein
MTAELLVAWLYVTLRTAVQWLILAAVAVEIVWLMLDIGKGDDYWLTD